MLLRNARELRWKALKEAKENLNQAEEEVQPAEAELIRTREPLRKVTQRRGAA